MSSRLFFSQSLDFLSSMLAGCLHTAATLLEECCPLHTVSKKYWLGLGHEPTLEPGISGQFYPNRGANNQMMIGGYCADKIKRERYALRAVLVACKMTTPLPQELKYKCWLLGRDADSLHIVYFLRQKLLGRNEPPLTGLLWEFTWHTHPGVSRITRTGNWHIKTLLECHPSIHLTSSLSLNSLLSPYISQGTVLVKDANDFSYVQSYGQYCCFSSLTAQIIWHC